MSFKTAKIFKIKFCFFIIEIFIVCIVEAMEILYYIFVSEKDCEIELKVMNIAKKRMTKSLKEK